MTLDIECCLCDEQSGSGKGLEKLRALMLTSFLVNLHGWVMTDYNVASGFRGIGRGRKWPEAADYAASKGRQGCIKMPIHLSAPGRLLNSSPH